jgi:hypothetical protein
VAPVGPIPDPARRAHHLDLVLWSIVVLSLASTVVLSFVEPPGSGLGHGIDKVQHALAYFVTMLAALLAAVRRPGRGPGQFPRARWWIAAGALAGGALIEILQSVSTTNRQGWPYSSSSCSSSARPRNLRGRKHASRRGIDASRSLPTAMELSGYTSTSGDQPGWRSSTTLSASLAAIAQSAEHGHGKAGVVGSIPTRGSKADEPRRGVGVVARPVPAGKLTGCWGGVAQR